jgi:hypothetical protein
MANHGYGTFLKVATNESHIADLLDEANEKYFGGMLEIIFDEEWLTFNVSVGDKRVFEVWLNEEGTGIEYRHGHTGDVPWYLDGFLSSYIVDRVGGYITDDGHGDIVDPDFYKRFPKYNDFLLKKTSFMGKLRRFAHLRMITELDKHDYPDVFLKLIKGK